jgi:hypothetical protein
LQGFAKKIQAKIKVQKIETFNLTGKIGA